MVKLIAFFWVQKFYQFITHLAKKKSITFNVKNELNGFKLTALIQMTNIFSQYNLKNMF